MAHIGSERAKKAGSDRGSDSVIEGAYINQSLLALSNVIKALVSGQVVNNNQ